MAFIPNHLQEDKRRAEVALSVVALVHPESARSISLYWGKLEMELVKPDALQGEILSLLLHEHYQLDFDRQWLILDNYAPMPAVPFGVLLEFIKWVEPFFNLWARTEKNLETLTFTDFDPEFGTYIMRFYSNDFGFRYSMETETGALVKDFPIGFPAPWVHQAFAEIARLSDPF